MTDLYAPKDIFLQGKIDVPEEGERDDVLNASLIQCVNEAASSGDGPVLSLNSGFSEARYSDDELSAAVLHLALFRSKYGDEANVCF